MDIVRELAIREALFLHLEALIEQSLDGTLSYTAIERFQCNGESFAIQQSTGRGIHKPANLNAALSIKTTYTKPGKTPPYEDLVGEDGFARYKYEGLDPNHFANRSLRACLENQLPLVYFIGIAPGIFIARFPIFIIAESAQKHEFTLSFDRSEKGFDSPSLSETERRYALRQTKSRIHQPVFRQQVLRAYRSTCAVCRLKHVELLDAAHIVGDSRPEGKAIVPNGIALCKLHHAAYDRNLLGIRPDYRVEISRTLLLEVDGPLLKHGLQEMNGTTLTVPSAKNAKPDPNRLEIRYQDFLNAG